MAETSINNGAVSAGTGAVSSPAKVEVSQEQIKYANLLLYGSWAGIASLIVMLAIYMAGLMPMYMEPSQIQQYWGMSASDYREAAKVPNGWGWLSMVGYGDFLPLLGIAWLGTLTVVGYLILLPAYLRKKDNIYTVLVIAEILVLTLAASGLLGSGGH